jgi:hypothetical protein
MTVSVPIVKYVLIITAVLAMAIIGFAVLYSAWVTIGGALW